MQIRVSPTRNNPNNRFSIERVTSMTDVFDMTNEKGHPLLPLLSNTNWTSLVNVRHIPNNRQGCEPYVRKFEHDHDEVIARMTKIKTSKPLSRRYASADSLLDETANSVSKTYSKSKVFVDKPTAQTRAGADLRKLTKKQYFVDNDLERRRGLVNPINGTIVSHHMKKGIEEERTQKELKHFAGSRKKKVESSEYVNKAGPKGALASKVRLENFEINKTSMTNKWVHSATVKTIDNVVSNACNANDDEKKKNLDLRNGNVKASTPMNRTEINNSAVSECAMPKSNEMNSTNSKMTSTKSFETTSGLDVKSVEVMNSNSNSTSAKKTNETNRVPNNTSHFSAVTKSLAKTFENLTTHNSKIMKKSKAPAPLRPTTTKIASSSSNKKRTAPAPPVKIQHSDEIRDASLQKPNETPSRNRSATAGLVRSPALKIADRESSGSINFIAMAEKARQAYLEKIGKLQTDNINYNGGHINKITTPPTVVLQTENNFNISACAKVETSIDPPCLCDIGDSRMSEDGYTVLLDKQSLMADRLASSSANELQSRLSASDYMNGDELKNGASSPVNSGAYDDLLSTINDNKLRSPSTTSNEGDWSSSNDEAIRSTSIVSSMVVQSDSDFYSTASLASHPLKNSQFDAEKNQHSNGGVIIDQFGNVSLVPPPPIGFEDEPDYANLRELDILPPPDEFSFFL